MINFHVDNCPWFSYLHFTSFVNMDIKIKFGLRVKLLRIEKGWSQEKLALNAELDRTYIPSIEKGERNVSIIVIEKIATAFQIQVDELLKL